MAQFTNGQTRALAQVVLSRFTNPDGGQRRWYNHFLETVGQGRLGRRADDQRSQPSALGNGGTIQR